MNCYNKIYIIAFLLIEQGGTVFAEVPEFLAVFSMYLKKPCEVGEVAPMSQYVGKELVKHVANNISTQKDCIGKYYLEAGGGHGAVSVCIAQLLRPCDHLDVVEINPEMCLALKKRLKNYPNVTVRCCSILDWHPEYKYDAIISTLPFLSLGIDFAQGVISHFKNVAAKDCMVSCVEYPIAVVFRRILQDFRIKTSDFTAVQRYMALVRKQYLKESTTVYYNVPPVNVYHLSFDIV